MGLRAALMFFYSIRLFDNSKSKMIIASIFKIRSSGIGQ